MRPQGYYIIWNDGRVIDIVRGHRLARAKSRSYKRFKNRIDAEEFAAWWNYRRDEQEEARSAELRERLERKGITPFSTKERTVSIPHQNAP